jgi:hypothetical protein
LSHALGWRWPMNRASRWTMRRRIHPLLELVEWVHQDVVLRLEH